MRARLSSVMVALLSLLLSAFALPVSAQTISPAPAVEDHGVSFTTVGPDAFSCNAVTEIPKTECAALVALYNSTNGAGWVNRAGWLTSSTPCTWHGVSCEAGHVTKLKLSQNRLDGFLPGSLADLRFLKILAIYQNRLLEGGNLRGAIPKELGTLTKLQQLALSGNELTGGIPPELGNLTELGYLNLNGNHLTGGIPTTLGRLQKLWALQLCWNELTGSIPPELGNLNLTDELALYANRLSGPIPVELGRLTRLRHLTLGGNLLSGSIPPELGNMTNLRTLNLYENRLTGSIPGQLGNLSNLESSLSLRGNPITGNVPSELGRLTRLQSLDLSQTSLSGALPTTLTALPLTRFWFDQTWLCEPWQPAFQGWLAGISDLRRTGTKCIALTINYPIGGPGSYFLITGCGFPPNALVTVTINGVMLGTLRADGAGCISLILVTPQANLGYYVVTLAANAGATAAAPDDTGEAVGIGSAAAATATVSFTIAEGQPVRPQQGSGVTYAVPADIAYADRTFLPLTMR